MPEHFHFIQPLWLLTLVPLAGLLWLTVRRDAGNNPWRNVVAPQLFALLMGQQPDTRASRLPLWLLAAGWLITVLALANPTWEQIPQPVLQTSTARVIVLDLSRSMLAADLKPSRLVRARFKVEDLLAYDNEGRTGLVVFAGDAFSVTPLTRDTDTIRAQLKALEPAIMPVQGSRADLGLLKAKELLQQAGAPNGQVILIADGVEGDRAEKAAAQLRQSGYRVSVLGVGTAQGAPLPDGEGGIVQTPSGKPLLVKLDSKVLQSVARAGGGRYRPLSGNDADIKTLLAQPAGIGKGSAQNPDNADLQTRQWKPQGPLLVILLLPLAALAFRRGWLLSVLLCAALLTPPQPAMALGWKDLWARKDQQAAQALQQQQYEQAAQLAKDPLQRGSAEYKQGDYQQALDAFKNASGSDADYNRGNALARLGKYREAIDAYDAALKAQPGMEDAIANKAAVEALLKKQQQQKQQDSSGQQDKDQDEQDSQSGNRSDSSDKNKGQPSDQQQNADNESSESGNPSQAGENQQSDAKQSDKANSHQQQEKTDNPFADANKNRDDNKPENQAAGQAENPSPDETASEEKPATQPDENRQAAEMTDTSPAEAEPLTSEEQLAAQQWLRRIPDDPGGLLRRKFIYQYRQRGNQQSGTQDW